MVFESHGNIVNSGFWLSVCLPSGTEILRIFCTPSARATNFKLLSSELALKKAFCAAHFLGLSGEQDQETAIGLSQHPMYINRRGGAALVTINNGIIGTIGISGFDEKLDLAIALYILKNSDYLVDDEWENYSIDNYEVKLDILS